MRGTPPLQVNRIKFRYKVILNQKGEPPKALFFVYVISFLFDCKIEERKNGKCYIHIITYFLTILSNALQKHQGDCVRDIVIKHRRYHVHRHYRLCPYTHYF